MFPASKSVFLGCIAGAISVLVFHQTTLQLGGIFGLLAPRLPAPVLIKALLAGLFAMLMGWFVVRPLAGLPVAFSWQAGAMLRSAAACFMWGIGVTLILPLLHPRGLHTPRRAWYRRHLAI
ncbi:MAG: hypothetical protein ABSC06_08620 [Rhodopila sp.]